MESATPPSTHGRPSTSTGGESTGRLQLARWRVCTNQRGSSVVLREVPRRAGGAVGHAAHERARPRPEGLVVERRQLVRQGPEQEVHAEPAPLAQHVAPAGVPRVGDQVDEHAVAALALPRDVVGAGVGAGGHADHVAQVDAGVHERVQHTTGVGGAHAPALRTSPTPAIMGRQYQTPGDQTGLPTPAGPCARVSSCSSVGMPSLPSRATLSAADQAAVSKHSAGGRPWRDRPGVGAVEGVAGAAGVDARDRRGLPALSWSPAPCRW